MAHHNKPCRERDPNDTYIRQGLNGGAYIGAGELLPGLGRKTYRAARLGVEDIYRYQGLIWGQEGTR